MAIGAVPFGPEVRLIVTVHLDTGSSLEFEADTVHANRAVVDGRISTLSYEGLRQASGCPLYLDLDHVVAVMVKQVEK